MRRMDMGQLIVLSRVNEASRSSIKREWELSRKYKFMVRSSNPLISRALMRVGSVHAIATEPATSQSAFSRFLIRLKTIMPR